LTPVLGEELGPGDTVHYGDAPPGWEPVLKRHVPVVTADQQWWEGDQATLAASRLWRSHRLRSPLGGLLEGPD